MNLKDYQSGRIDGMNMALTIVKNRGIEGLEDELKFRQVTGINSVMSKKEVNEVSRKIKEMTCDTIQALSLAVLHDEFDFGKKRCERFLKRFNLKTESMLDNMATWNDQVEMIKEELGIDLNIRYND